MFAKYPGTIKSVQRLVRNSFGSTPINDTINAVQTDRTILVLATSGNNPVYGSTEYGIFVELYDSTTVRWTCSHTSMGAYYQILYVIEFYEPFKGVNKVTSGVYGGSGSSASPTWTYNDVTFTPPTGYDTAKAVCLPSSLIPNYSGNPVAFYPTLQAYNTVRFNRLYGSDVSRQMQATVYWF